MPSARSFRVRAVTLGFAAGLRAATPLAALALRGPRDARDAGKPAWLRSGKGRFGFTLGALGELVGDKLPFTPSRLSVGGLTGRIANGATAGAIVARDARGSAWLGALLGAGSAVAGAFAGNKLRAAAVEASGAPDPLIALVEDVIAIGLAFAAA
jgi:uncharacterized membrane protein